ncbi:NAD-dependent epimerase/dehydratase family protein [Halocatena halophila]|uniref:NAD-dependent epimerase/dehydratase family protein n=1 Tax=Halocatena halophila TaxID=2814576 RepID=UPI002ED6151C
MARIAITGAEGNIGRILLDRLEGHDITALTRSSYDDIDSTSLDITDRDRFTTVLADHDVLIHLAANSSPYAEWDDLWEPNINGTYNAYYAAVENDLDRVIYASSNHAVNMADIDSPTEPETMSPDAPTVYPETPPRPDSLYGTTKVACEGLGAYFAKRYDLEVVNFRIGWFMTPEQLEATQRDSDSPHPEDAKRFARAMFLSHRDCVHGITRAIEAPIDESPLTVHAISRNDDRYLSITHTQRTLGYQPRDNATEILEER